MAFGDTAHNAHTVLLCFRKTDSPFFCGYLIISQWLVSHTMWSKVILVGPVWRMRKKSLRVKHLNMHQTRRWKRPQEVVSIAAFDPLHLLIKWTYSSQLETQTGHIHTRELGLQRWIPNSHIAIFPADKKRLTAAEYRESWAWAKSIQIPTQSLDFWGEEPKNIYALKNRAETFLPFRRELLGDSAPFHYYLLFSSVVSTLIQDVGDPSSVSSCAWGAVNSHLILPWRVPLPPAHGLFLGWRTLSPSSWSGSSLHLSFVSVSRNG